MTDKNVACVLCLGQLNKCFWTLKYALYDRRWSRVSCSNVK